MIPVSYSVRSLLVRKTTTLATVIGIGLVVAVLAASMMLSAGIEETLGASGRPDYAVVLREGSDAELSSTVENKNIGLVLAAPGVKRDGEGKPLGAGEIVVVILGEKADSPGQLSNVLVRGVADNVFALRPFARVTEGRPARPASDEVVIGKQLAGRFTGLSIGQSFELKKNRKVTVVGVFEAEGSSFESEVWADVDVVRSSFGRDGAVSAVTVALDSPAAYDAFEAQVEHDKQIGLEAERENVFYDKQGQGTALFIGIIGWVITVFFMAAAIIGAFITMNTAVASRRREIGTLLALGFRGGSIMVAFMLESLFLALFAAMLGIFAAFFLTFIKVGMVNQATWSEMVFRFSLTPGIVVTAVIVGGVMGFIGGFIPAWRAAHVKPVEAMRG